MGGVKRCGKEAFKSSSFSSIIWGCINGRINKGLFQIWHFRAPWQPVKRSQVAEKTRGSFPNSSKLVYPRYDLGWDGIFSRGCGCLWREFRSNRNCLLFGLKQTDSMVNNTLHDQELCLLFNWIMCSKSGRTSNHFSWQLQIFILFPKEQSVPSSEAIRVILGMHCFININAFFPSKLVCVEESQTIQGSNPRSATQ